MSGNDLGIRLQCIRIDAHQPHVITLGDLIHHCPGLPVQTLGPTPMCVCGRQTAPTVEQTIRAQALTATGRIHIGSAVDLDIHHHQTHPGRITRYAEQLAGWVTTGQHPTPPPAAPRVVDTPDLSTVGTPATSPADVLALFREHFTAAVNNDGQFFRIDDLNFVVRADVVEVQP